MKKTSGMAVFGALMLVLLGIVALPVIIFLGAYIGVHIVLLILAAHYWAAFWWCCLYSLFYLAGAVVKALGE